MMSKQKGYVNSPLLAPFLGDLRVLQYLGGFPLTIGEGGVRYGVPGYLGTLVTWLLSQLHPIAFVAVGFTSYGRSNSDYKDMSFRHIMEAFIALSETYLKVFDFIFISQVMLVIVIQAPVIQHWVLAKSADDLNNLLGKICDLDEIQPCSASDTQRSRKSSLRFIVINFMVMPLDCFLYLPMAYRMGYVMLPNYEWVPHLITATGLLLSLLSYYGPTSMSVEHLVFFLTDLHTRQVAAWTKDLANLEPHTNRLELSEESEQIVKTKESKETLDQQVQKGLQMCNVTTSLTNALGPITLYHIAFILLQTIISIFGAIGVLLNKRYSIYMIGWSVAQFVLSALYVRVVFAFCRSSHALAGARSKAAHALDQHIRRSLSMGASFGPETHFAAAILTDRLQMPMKLCCYGALSKYSFVGFVATMVTYLVVLLQFRLAL